MKDDKMEIRKFKASVTDYGWGIRLVGAEKLDIDWEYDKPYKTHYIFCDFYDGKLIMLYNETFYDTLIEELETDKDLQEVCEFEFRFDVIEGGKKLPKKYEKGFTCKCNILNALKKMKYIQREIIHGK